MKKYILVSGIVFMAFASVVAAQEYDFSNNLTLGSSGADVVNLQSWLIANGYDIPSLSSGLTMKGYFGGQTRAALIRFQLANGLPGTGYFGPMSRGWFRNWKGNKDNNQQAIKLTSPNGGESWAIGSTQTIRWNTSSNSDNSGVTIKIVRNISGCFNAGTRPCLAVVDPEYTIATNVANTGSYQWTVTSITGDSYASAAGSNYLIRICKNSGQGNGACDTSDAMFSITSGTTDSRAPVINGIDAPTSLSVNQTGTWTVRATDPQNGTLSYTVDWGDAGQAICPTGYQCNTAVTASPSVQQNSTFTHSYSWTGTYTVRFTVRNSVGLSAQSSATVQVGTNSTAGPLRIVTPNGYEQWKTGTTQLIQWTSPAYFRATYADLRLVSYQAPCPPNANCITYSPPPRYYPIVKNISINQNSYSWKVGEYIPEVMTMIYPPVYPLVPEGQYKLQICEAGTNNCDLSDGPFTISNGYMPQVVAPNGGETLLSNSAYQLKWTTSSAATQNTKLDLHLDSLVLPCVSGAVSDNCNFRTYLLDRNISVNTSYNWLVATDINNAKIPDGSYKLRVCLAGSTTNCDSSDQWFKIVSQQAVY